MPHSRSIKISFFDNSELGKLDSNIRLLFIALWQLADREGILEYNVSLIRRYTFGYRSDITEEDIHGYLTVISRLDNGSTVLLKNYNEKNYVVVVNFARHQNPHHTEKKGKFPLLKDIISQGVTLDNGYLTVTSPLSNVINPADSLLLTPDSGLLTPESVIYQSRSLENEFSEFWELYPKNGRNKGAKNIAEDKYKIARKKDSFEKIIQGVKNYAAYIRNTGQSNADAFRWIERERWREDFTINQSTGAGIRGNIAPSKSERAAAAAAKGLAEYQGQSTSTEPIDVTPSGML